MKKRWYVVRVGEADYYHVGPFKDAKQAGMALKALHMGLAYWGTPDIDNWVITETDAFTSEEVDRT